MRKRSRAALTSAIASACLLGSVASGAARPAAGPLSGTWSGYISRTVGGHVKRQHIVISVNARETAGTWRLSAACYGRLTLDSISYGYHHYLRHAGRGSTCAGGDIDCLKRAGPYLYDTVTARRGSAWNTDGTLRRVRRP